MERRMRLAFLVGLVLLVTACAAPPPKEEDAGAAADAAAAAAAAEAGADQTQGADLGTGFQGHPLDDPASPLSKRVFYFELDSSELSAEDREIISAHAHYLAAHPEMSVVIEGHADERGSREYNMALGERRALTVRQLILVQGVGQQQIQYISFGEERPVALGHDDSAWSLNRRAELLYSGY